MSDGGLPQEHFHFPLHFSLLAGFCVLLAALDRLHIATGLAATFAGYGALHAAALVSSLRARRRLWRECLFIILAAALSAAALEVGLLAGRLLGAALGHGALYVALGFSAALGAVAYGILIRWWGMSKLTRGSLAAISICCVLATLIAYLILQRLRFLDRWWLAALWWFAFSGGLWYFDRNAAADTAGRSGVAP